MTQLPTIIPAKPRRARKRKRGVTQSPAPLVLTLASFDDVGPWLTLQFDRAIDIDALAGANVEVDDGLVTGFRFIGTATAELIDPQTVRLTMIDDGQATGVFMVMNATAANGIVAVDDGGTWEGATNLQLPFP